MSLTSEQMKELAFKNSPFVKLKDGETSRICRLIECKEIPSRQDPNKTTYQYKLEFSDDAGSHTKFFESSSNKLLVTMSDCIGKTIQIKRTGTGTQTQYEVFLA